MRLRAAIGTVSALLLLQGVPCFSAASWKPDQSQGRTQNPDQNQSQQEQPPATSPTQTEPAPAPTQAPPPPQAGPPPRAEESSPVTAPAPEKPRPVRRKKKIRRKAVPATSPGRVVVRNGGAKDNSTQLSPAMSNEQALHQRENTSQLLATTDTNLKRVAGRQLTPAQQSTIEQIHSYMRQAKDASDSGDLARAHTLAYKAHLLSDELVRR